LYGSLQTPRFAARAATALADRSTGLAKLFRPTYLKEAALGPFLALAAKRHVRRTEFIPFSSGAVPWDKPTDRGRSCPLGEDFDDCHVSRTQATAQFVGPSIRGRAQLGHGKLVGKLAKSFGSRGREVTTFEDILHSWKKPIQMAAIGNYSMSASEK
jgi:hypothetical protein